MSGLPPFFPPMMAGTAPAPFDSPDHWFELKWDGVRVLAFCEAGRTRLYSRTGREVTSLYPEAAGLHARLSVADAVVDGEIVALDGGIPSFQKIQRRLGLTRPGDVRRMAAEVPVSVVCFDLVVAGGEWIGALPLEERHRRLEDALAPGGPVTLSTPVLHAGVAFFHAAEERGLEGIVAKRLSSPYVPGRRTRDWLKVKTSKHLDCVVGGWSPGEGSRRGSFGSLLVGLHDAEGHLRYVGSVGTGFDERTLDALAAGLEALETSVCPFAERPPVPGARWVRPELVCVVEYREMTDARRLRAPSFKGLRTDKQPQECVM